MTLTTAEATTNRKRAGKVVTGKEKQQKNAKRWISHSDILAIISYWRDNYSAHAKSARKTFPRKACQWLNEKYVLMSPVHSDNTLFMASQVETKLNYLLDRYKKVSEHMSASGFGIDETFPPSVRETMEKSTFTTCMIF